MSTLSAREIAEYAYRAGFRGEALTTAVAIALAESAGNPGARGDTTLANGTWGPSIGLWQIRSLRADDGTGRERDAKANLNPATNARHAWSISGHGKNFGPWSTYTNGSYRRYLGTAKSAAAQVGKDGGGHRSGKDPAPRGTDRIVLDLQELRSLQTFFDTCADRVRHVRRTVAILERDLAPARAALPDAALSGLIAQTLQFLESPSALPQTEERLAWHAHFVERVRTLAERADGDDGKWTRSDALRFATSIGRSDRAGRAVLEALVLGTVVRRRAGIHDHLKPGHDKKPAAHPAPNTLPRNGYVPASRLTSVGDGEKLLTPAARQFRRMDAAARTAGLDLHVNSGYRTYAEQAQLYRDYRNGTGNLAAPPGQSTHGLGLSADINVTNPKTLAWLRRNAGNYGFVNDVPTEPWHWTYKTH